MSARGRAASRNALLMLLLSAAVAVPTAAQQHEQLPGRLKPATRAAIGALADSLGAFGLPSHAVYDKVAEGVLKGADDAQILSVVRALASRLRESRTLLGPDANDEALLAASSALYAGVPPAAIRRAGDARGRGDRAMIPSLALTLTVLGALVSQHVPPDVASASIEALIARGARELELQEFQRAVEADILGGRAPAEATANRMQGVLETISTRRPPEEQ